MVYFISDGEFVKVGFTENPDVSTRIRNLQTANARELKLVHLIPGSRNTEKVFHLKLLPYRTRGEWYKISTKELYKIVETVLDGYIILEEDVVRFNNDSKAWIELYVNISYFDSMMSASSSARDLLLYIVFNLEEDSDTVNLKYSKVMKITGMARNTLARSLKELSELGFIRKKNQSEYWVNPFRIFKGNRLAYFDKLKDSKSVNTK